MFTVLRMQKQTKTSLHDHVKVTESKDAHVLMFSKNEEKRQESENLECFSQHKLRYIF